MRSTASGGERSAFVLEFQLIRRDDQRSVSGGPTHAEKPPCFETRRIGAPQHEGSVFAGLVPAIHALGWRLILSDSRRLTVWVAGTSPAKTAAGAEARSEERRVGKEC